MAQAAPNLLAQRVPISMHLPTCSPAYQPLLYSLAQRAARQRSLHAAVRPCVRLMSYLSAPSHLLHMRSPRPLLPVNGWLGTGRAECADEGLRGGFVGRFGRRIWWQFVRGAEASPLLYMVVLQRLIDGRWREVNRDGMRTGIYSSTRRLVQLVKV